MSGVGPAADAFGHSVGAHLAFARQAPFDGALGLVSASFPAHKAQQAPRANCARCGPIRYSSHIPRLVGPL